MNTRRLLFVLAIAGMLAGIFIMLERNPDAPPRSRTEESGGQPAGSSAPAPAPALPDLLRTEELAPAAASWSLAVMDRESQAPVAGAALALVHAAGASEFGRTDAAGLWSGPAPSAAAPWTVRAAAEGYLTESFACAPDTRSIALEPEGAIRGSVTGADPRLLAEGRFEVLAWESERVAFDRLEHRTLLAGPEYAAAIVQPDGSFELRGLRRSWNYFVLALGPSYGTPQPVPRTPADGRSVQVKVMPLHGALVRVTGPGGAALRCSPAVFQDFPPYGSRPVSAAGQFSLASDWSVRLLGFAPFLPASDPRRDLVFYYLPEGEPPAYEFGVVRPGYHPWSGELIIPRATLPLAELAVELQPWAEEFGSLEVRWTGAEIFPKRQYAYGQRPDALLRLTAVEMLAPPTDRPLALSAAVPDLAQGGAGFGPVPAGDYEVSLRGAFDGNPDPGAGLLQRVTIRADEPAAVAFDLSSWGCLEVGLLEGEQPYAGSILLTVWRGQAAETWPFSGPPYRIPLASGTYEVGITPGFRRLGPNQLPPRQAVAVTAGRTSRLELALPAPR